MRGALGEFSVGCRRSVHSVGSETYPWGSPAQLVKFMSANKSNGRGGEGCPDTLNCSGDGSHVRTVQCPSWPHVGTEENAQPGRGLRGGRQVLSSLLAPNHMSLPMGHILLPFRQSATSSIPSLSLGRSATCIKIVSLQAGFKYSRDEKSRDMLMHGVLEV